MKTRQDEEIILTAYNVLTITGIYDLGNGPSKHIRQEIWQDKRNGRARIVYSQAAGKGDYSEPHNMATAYDRTCVCCFFGVPHTANAHERSKQRNKHDTV